MIIGGLFLSGFSGFVNMTFSDNGKETQFCASIRFCAVVHGHHDGIKQSCFFGPDVAVPGLVSEFCKRENPNSVYVCPLTEELVSFGMVASHVMNKLMDRPRRADLSLTFDEPLDCASSAFNPKLDGDGLGRMAELVGKRKARVLNQMRVVPGISPFYGNVIGPAGDGYIVSGDCVLKFFPWEPINSTLGAATCVPVEMTPSDEFRKLSGDDRERVNVFVSSEHVNGLPTFMRFLKIMSGMDFVGVTPWKGSSPEGVVFRHSRGYNTLFEKSESL